MAIDIGDLCTHCDRDTSLGNGLFVNRIPSGTDTAEGYMCVDCQCVECDQCGKLTLDYDIENSEIICSDCQDKVKEITA